MTLLFTLSQLLEHALAKDLGSMGDVTTASLVEMGTQVSAQGVVVAKQGIVSGLDVTRQVFHLVDSGIVFTARVRDGTVVRCGDSIFRVRGSARGIFAGERVALEFLRRMSGIATKTHAFVSAVKDTGVTILDTRKTLPGYGELDKQAVKDGGGTNHRANLSEMGLIKNNHIDILGGNIARAICLFRAARPLTPLEVEVRNQRELVAALAHTPDRILLDNMSTGELRRAVQTRNDYGAQKGKNVPLEASGNMTLARVRAVAKTGVEYISVGALTHSVHALDIHIHVMKV